MLNPDVILYCNYMTNSVEHFHQILGENLAIFLITFNLKLPQDLMSGQPVYCKSEKTEKLPIFISRTTQLIHFHGQT